MGLRNSWNQGEEDTGAPQLSRTVHNAGEVAEFVPLGGAIQ